MSMRYRQDPAGDELEFEDGELEAAATAAGGEEETEELERAVQLLEITDEAELEHFLGGLLQQAARAGGSPLPATVLRPLTGTLRGALQTALPIVGASRGALTAPQADAGHTLALAAGSMFGLELEGLSPEDQEFELARRFVRLARAVGRRGSRLARRLPPRAAVRRTLITAARRHAPGLLRRGARLMVPVAVVVPEPPAVTEPAAVDEPSDPSPATDQEPASDSPSDQPQDPAQPDEPASESAAAGHVCHCGGRCAHCRAHQHGRWFRRGRLLILQDV